MKTLGANRCLFIATISLVTALLPLAGIAQTQEPSDGQAASPQVLQQPISQQPISQQHFVSDKLVLNVYAEPDQGSARVATIQTGDAVEEIERAGNMVRVRLDDGREGWVGASYLTSNAPAAVRLRELQRQQKPATREPDKKLTDEIARLKKENTTLQAQIKELQSNVMTPVAPPVEGPQIISTSAAESVSDGGMPANTSPGTGVRWGVWWGWLIAVMLAGTLGFASGYQTLARRLRRKFGGLKIY